MLELNLPPSPAAGGETQIHDLPDVILATIFAAVSDTRSRNALSLACRKWLAMERATRVSLTLRGNARYLIMIPTSFRSVTSLDLSLLSPWGHELLSLPPASGELCFDHRYIALLLRQAFPLVTSLTVYCRTPATLEVLAPLWNNLAAVKLVRWHRRLPSSPLGADFAPLFEFCASLTSLDLSDFYYWTEDLPAALEAHPVAAAGLTRLDLMTRSFQEGFKTNELCVITSHCPNLEEFRVACTFDTRLIDFVGDEALELIASNCPKLSLLHLADASTLTNLRGNPEDDDSTAGDAGFGRAALIDFFSSLPLLEDLRLDVCRNVRESGLVLEVLNRKCPKLKVLKLGQFQTICLAIESQLDGIALCGGLRSLSIKNCADLTDMGLIAVARGCCMLSRIELEGCKEITMKGVRTLASLLRKTLVEVKISCCKHLNAALSLQALEPIQNRIQRLHIDCVWDGMEEQKFPEAFQGFDLNGLEEENTGLSSNSPECIDFCGDMRVAKKRKVESESDLESFYLQNNDNNFSCKTWDQLQHLSLWFAVGEVLTPLVMAGLEDCPQLEEIAIRVEGDCRDRPRPSENEFGLGCLVQYPQLRKMQLDCGGAEGNALTAPSGQMDVSLWERFYLNGIGNLELEELDYWAPQDRDLNQRGLSLPAAALLAQCASLRKLFIHGTANEHFMNFLLRIPNLRDAQLREDYYPAPDNDMSTEMRVDSCSRFEESLNSRHILD